MEQNAYLDDSYLFSLDGTGLFSSHTIHCASCCVKNHKNGSKTYYHQMLGAVLIHPEKPEVIPLCPEAILKQDGATKNDSERNAAKRLLEDTRREHPHLKLIVVEDGLSSNGPHIQLLNQLSMHYILIAKESDHQSLFEFVRCVWDSKDEKEEVDQDGTIHRYRWTNEVPLNDTYPDMKVNFLEYWQIAKKGEETYWSWVTDFRLSANNVRSIMKGGRARWRIENETFNTLKNQGYHFEHNFGHGKEDLCTVFSMLMFLAFLVDQAQQMCCDLFNQALTRVGRKLICGKNYAIYFKWFVLNLGKSCIK